VQAQSVSFINATTIDAVAPASAPGPGPVDVSYMDGSGCFASFCCYTYN
jgi:hypothetical protein